MSSLLKKHMEVRTNPRSNWSKHDGELSAQEKMLDEVHKRVEAKVDAHKQKVESKAAEQAKMERFELTHHANSMFESIAERDAEHDPEVARDQELAAGGTGEGRGKKAAKTKGAFTPPPVVDDVLTAAIVNFEAQKQVRTDARVAAAAAADAARVEMTTMLAALTAAITSLAGAQPERVAGGL